MNYKFKTLYNTKTKDFIHFYESEINNDFSFVSSDMPQIMNPEVETEDLITMFGESIEFPIGTELKTIIVKVKD